MNPPLLAAFRDTDRTDDPRAVTIAGEALSLNLLRSSAAAFAAALPGPRCTVAVLAEPSPATVVAITGAILAGAPVVPIPHDAGQAELAHLLADSGATCWVGPGRAGVDLPALDAALTPGPISLPKPVAPEQVAMILYTSGTTGSPKGVLVSQAAIGAGLDALAQAWDWTAQDTVAHGLPLFHTHGLILGMLGPLHLGSRVVHTGRPTPQAYARAGGTLYFGVPTVWSRIAEDTAAAQALSHARLLVSGSAPLPVPVFERLRRLTGQAPLERYGMTETMITLSTRADGERRPGWVGLPVAGVRTRIRAEDGTAAPHDGHSVGRLELRGPMLFDGYLNRPEATAEAFDPDGWYRTGDVAVVDDGGMHRIVGRESVDLIKSGGYRIGAGEIETVLLGHPGVDEVAVVGPPDDDLGQRIVAYVVGSAAADELIDYVAQQLSVHKRPREVRFVSSLPRNALGKVLKKQLLAEG